MTTPRYLRIYRNALKTGRLINPKICSECGKRGRIEGHHPDYSKPLGVIWLCSSCHRSVHYQEKRMVGNAIESTPGRIDYDDLVNIRVAAQILGLTKQGVHYLIKGGRLPVVLISNIHFVYRSDVEKRLKETK